jgi:RNA polymerase sigma factor (sigma-70 family)
MSVFQRQPQLLEAFRQGERWALDRVYRAHVRMIERYLRALARASHAPELKQPEALVDLLQEAFVRALSPGARLAYDGSRPYGPYLRKIAKNLFIDQLRARGRAIEESLDVVLEDRDSVASECEELGDPRVNAVLTAYLAALPPPLRGVYDQRFVLGNSQEDACAALGITRRRLRTDEARLMSGLRRALLENGILRGDVISQVGVVGTLGTEIVR